MLSYSLKCRTNTESKNPKVVRAKSGRIMLLSKCSLCNNKKSKFLKDQKVSGLLGNFGTKIPSIEIPLLDSLLF